MKPFTTKKAATTYLAERGFEPYLSDDKSDKDYFWNPAQADASASLTRVAARNWQVAISRK